MGEMKSDYVADIRQIQPAAARFVALLASIDQGRWLQRPVPASPTIPIASRAAD